MLNNTVREPEDYAKFSDLWYPIPMTLVMMVIRWVVEKFMFRPIGIRMGLKDNMRHLPNENAALEKAFRISSKITSKEVTKLSRETGMTFIQVQLFGVVS